jgi:hypothetical protein
VRGCTRHLWILHPGGKWGAEGPGGREDNGRKPRLDFGLLSSLRCSQSPSPSVSTVRLRCLAIPSPRTEETSENGVHACCLREGFYLQWQIGKVVCESSRVVGTSSMLLIAPSAPWLSEVRQKMSPQELHDWKRAQTLHRGVCSLRYHCIRRTSGPSGTLDAKT